MDGVLIANIVDDDDKIKTKISHNYGGAWYDLSGPIDLSNKKIQKKVKKNLKKNI